MANKKLTYFPETQAIAEQVDYGEWNGDLPGSISTMRKKAGTDFNAGLGLGDRFVNDVPGMLKKPARTIVNGIGMVADVPGAVLNAGDSMIDGYNDTIGKYVGKDQFRKKINEGAGIAFDNMKARPMETAKDIGSGTMAGLANLGAMMSSGFGFMPNKVSQAANESAQYWKDNIIDKNSVGGAVAEEGVQWAGFGPAMKTITTPAKIGLKEYKKLNAMDKKIALGSGAVAVPAYANN